MKNIFRKKIQACGERLSTFADIIEEN